MSDPHAFDTPYEDNPPGTELDLSDGVLVSGVVIMAASLPVPGEGLMATLVYRFAKPDGSGFLPPVVLVLSQQRMRELVTLTAKSAEAAIRASAS